VERGLEKRGGNTMSTLVDFITHVKAVEYVIALAGIAAFLVLWEYLKPKPFGTVVKAGKEDRAYIESTGGLRHVLKSVGRIAAAPFIGLAYIVMLPIGFIIALVAAVVNLAVRGAARVAGTNATFTWRPVEAYLAGRKRKKEKKEKGPGKEN
jgi:hypothetical protein